MRFITATRLCFRCGITVIGPTFAGEVQCVGGQWSTSDGAFWATAEHPPPPPKGESSALSAGDAPFRVQLGVGNWSRVNLSPTVSSMSTLILLRHGQSEWNAENLFTGWYDCGLTELGEQEAQEGGRLLTEEGLAPAVVHTSLQRRAIRTAEITLAEMGQSWIPVRRHWRLNERHYGDLQGKNKKETAEKYGAEQLHQWRRGYDTPPPPLDRNDERHPRFDERYADIPADQLPASECLADVVERMLPYWHDVIVPDLKRGPVLVAAHGNSLRALVKHLKQIPDDEITELEIPTGVPWVFEVDQCQVKSDRWLGDPAAVAARAEAVKNQSKV